MRLQELELETWSWLEVLFGACKAFSLAFLASIKQTADTVGGREGAGVELLGIMRFVSHSGGYSHVDAKPRQHDGIAAAHPRNTSAFIKNVLSQAVCS